MKDFVAPKPKQKAAAADRLPTLPSIQAELSMVFHDEIVEIEMLMGKAGHSPQADLLQADRLVKIIGIMDMAVTSNEWPFWVHPFIDVSVSS